MCHWLSSWLRWPFALRSTVDDLLADLEKSKLSHKEEQAKWQADLEAARGPHDRYIASWERLMQVMYWWEGESRREGEYRIKLDWSRVAELRMLSDRVMNVLVEESPILNELRVKLLSSLTQTVSQVIQGIVHDGVPAEGSQGS
jgi:hypothetical protein